MPGSSPHARLRVKLGEAIRDLMLRDEAENTVRVIEGFLDLLREAPPLASSEAVRARRILLGLIDPTAAERAMAPPAGALSLRVLRLSREDKKVLRAALWDLHGYLLRGESQ